MGLCIQYGATTTNSGTRVRYSGALHVAVASVVDCAPTKLNENTRKDVKMRKRMERTIDHASRAAIEHRLEA